MKYVTFELPTGDFVSVNPNHVVYLLEYVENETLIKFSDGKHEVVKLPLLTVKEELESGLAH